jgi:hypothetical protein
MPFLTEEQYIEAQKKYSATKRAPDASKRCYWNKKAKEQGIDVRLICPEELLEWYNKKLLPLPEGSERKPKQYKTYYVSSNGKQYAMKPETAQKLRDKRPTKKTPPHSEGV